MTYSLQRIFLIGLMGSGKTHFAKLWAQQTGHPFFDTDQMIEAQAGSNIGEIFEEKGQGYFRELEAQILRDTEWPEACFIACGGGLPCFHHNIDYMLQKGRVVWLNPPESVLTERLWYQKAHRPLIADMPSVYHVALKLQDLLRERQGCYEKAHLILINPPEVFRSLDTP